MDLEKFFIMWYSGNEETANKAITGTIVYRIFSKALTLAQVLE